MKQGTDHHYSVFDANTARELVKHLKVGNYLDTAARACGVAPRTVRRWLNRGKHEAERREAGHKPNAALDAYVVFYHDVNAAMAEAEGQAVAKINSSDDWRASAFYLERKFPKKWGKAFNIHLEAEYERMLDKLERLLPPSIYESVLEAMATPDDLVGTDTDPVPEDDDVLAADNEPTKD